VTVPLTLALLVYAAGFVRLGGRRSLWRGAALYSSGWLILTLALVSPLHEGGERSFTLHMIEHELIMLVAAPLLALSRPLGVMLWAFPRNMRQTLAFPGLLRRLADPVLATALQSVALWAWHAPPLFNRALGHPGWHVAQHLSFLVTALIFWWSMTQTPNRALAALCLFVTAILGGALGALMALAPRVLYRIEPASAAVWGLTPLEDQQLAGLMMWIPACTVYAAAALLLAMRWVAQSGRAAERSYVRP